MELDDMKELWEDMSQKVASQQVVTDKLILEMTQQKYKNKFSRFLSYEISGTVICFATIVLILLNLYKMNTWYLMACSIATIVLVSILPILSLSALKGMKNIDLASLSYKQRLTDFARKKRRMTLIQQFSASFSIVIMFITIPVFSMIFNNKDFFKQDYGVGYWVFVGIVAIAVALFSLYGYRCYKRLMNSAELLLGEMKEVN